MFTVDEKVVLMDALMARKSALERSKTKAKNPRFAPIYEEDLQLLASLTLKVHAMEVSDVKGKASPRS